MHRAASLSLLLTCFRSVTLRDPPDISHHAALVEGGMVYEASVSAQVLLGPRWKPGHPGRAVVL